MSYFESATIARERSQNNVLIAEEVMLIELYILEAISNNLFTASITDATTITVNGDTVTGSVMTSNDATGQNFYNTWKGTATDAVATEQMAEVSKHFTVLGYTISRVTNTTTGTTFKWVIVW
jgi:hypothetical protein